MESREYHKKKKKSFEQFVGSAHIESPFHALVTLTFNDSTSVASIKKIVKNAHQYLDKQILGRRFGCRTKKGRRSLFVSVIEGIYKQSECTGKIHVHILIRFSRDIDLTFSTEILGKKTRIPIMDNSQYARLKPIFEGLSKNISEINYRAIGKEIDEAEKLFKYLSKEFKNIQTIESWEIDNLSHAQMH